MAFYKDFTKKKMTRADHLRVEDMSDADEGEDQDLPEDAPEADRGREPVIHDGAHDAGDVVQHDEGDEGIDEPVASAEEPSEPAADCGEDELNAVPEFFHCGKNLL